MKAFCSSGSPKARNAETSNGSPMSGRPFRLLNHQIASAAAATATQAATTTTTRSSWRSRLRSNSTAFEGLPLTVTRLSDRVGMIAASPGEASPQPDFQAILTMSARFWQ